MVLVFSDLSTILAKFNASNTHELEVLYKSINDIKFQHIHDHLTATVLASNINTHDLLDVIIKLADGRNYRFSMTGDNEINVFINKLAKLESSSTNVIKQLLNTNSANITKIIKDNTNLISIDSKDYNLRLKLMEEIPANSIKLSDFSSRPLVLYRYKNRTSFRWTNESTIDLTFVKQFKRIADLQNDSTHNTTELELEFLHTSTPLDQSTVNAQVTQLLQVTQGTIISEKLIPVPIVITHQESQRVIDRYKSMIGKTSNNANTVHFTSANHRQPISLDKDMLPIIQNNDAVTEKADGLRYFCLGIDDGSDDASDTDDGGDLETNVGRNTSISIYLLSPNMTVIKTDIAVTNVNTPAFMLDGELIEIDGKLLYLAFDIMYANDTDIRFDAANFNLTNRIGLMNEIISSALPNMYIKFNEYNINPNQSITVNDIVNHNTTALKSYWSTLNAAIDNSTTTFFITRKLYFSPLGYHACEIFAYAFCLWNLYVFTDTIRYSLDGLIFTSIDSAYIPRKHDNNQTEYKWKPPHKNSIDFYVRFARSDTSHIFLDDNSKAYVKCELYVNKTKINTHDRSKSDYPIKFIVRDQEQFAIIYLDEQLEQPLDADNNVIENESVVEFIYTNETWQPLKIRYDKTEMVHKYKKLYGNSAVVADRIFKNIENPITIDMIQLLGNPDTYQIEMDSIIKDIKSTQVAKDAVSSQSQSSKAYYQLRTNLAQDMRAFNNWIKSTIISVYCNPQRLGRYHVADWACGRGGDYLKLVMNGATSYVGIDIDSNNLFTIKDSALNRYKSAKLRDPSIPQAIFIQGDLRALLTVQDQKRALPIMNDINAKNISRHLMGKRYDLINCQFSIHYYLSDMVSWTNFCRNINSSLTEGGYMLITTFDGNLVHNKIKDNINYQGSFIENGIKRVLFEIVKRYNNDDINQGIGVGIDLYNGMISKEGIYNREYLVFYKFLVDQLLERCNLELVESDLFYNSINIFRNYFTGDEDDDAVNDANSNTVIDKRVAPIAKNCININKNVGKIRSFYKTMNVSDSENEAACNFTILNRYYVFRKKPSNTAATSANTTSKAASGGSSSQSIKTINNVIDANISNTLAPVIGNYRLVIDGSQEYGNLSDVFAHFYKRVFGANRPTVLVIKVGSDHSNGVIISKANYKTSKPITNNVFLVYSVDDVLFYPIYNNNSKSTITYLFNQESPVTDKLLNKINKQLAV